VLTGLQIPRFVRTRRNHLQIDNHIDNKVIARGTELQVGKLTIMIHIVGTTR
jgi:hypothetical protein